MGSYPKAVTIAKSPPVSPAPSPAAAAKALAKAGEAACNSASGFESSGSAPGLSPAFTTLSAPDLGAVANPAAASGEAAEHSGDWPFWSGLLARAYHQKSREDLPKQPWERSPWAHAASPFNQVMKLPQVGYSDFMAGKDPGEPLETKSIPVLHPEYARKRLRLASMNSEPDAVRLNCLRKLRTMVLLDPATSELAQSLVDAAGRLVDESVITRSFVDCFSPKATSTLLKRTTHLWAYCTFVTEGQLGSPLEFPEPVLYQYLNHMRDSNRGATASASFLQSINFLHGTVRLTVFSGGILLSSRCTGLAKSEASRKRVTKQSTVLTTDQVWQLERFVVENSPSYLSAIGGHILFCLYSCARWGDSMALDRIEEFVCNQIVLVETATSHHKTASAAGDASMLLPLLCLGRGLYDKPWSHAWIASRKACNLESSSIAMPTYNEGSGKFGSSKMSSSEATLWVRELLCLGGTKEKDASHFSSHGLKATLLSWVAKTGKFSATEQRCLGHHFDPEMRSVLIYSRDTYAPLAAKIRIMLDDILAGKFSPDAPRHVRIDQLVRDAVSESSDSDISNAGDCANTVLNREGVGPLPVPEGLGSADRDQVFIHGASGIAHVSYDGMKLLCGRPLIAVYKSLNDVQMEASDLMICKQCGRAA